MQGRANAPVPTQPGRFYDATSFSQDITRWNTQALRDSGSMFATYGRPSTLSLASPQTPGSTVPPPGSPPTPAARHLLRGHHRSGRPTRAPPPHARAKPVSALTHFCASGPTARVVATPRPPAPHATTATPPQQTTSVMAPAPAPAPRSAPTSPAPLPPTASRPAPAFQRWGSAAYRCRRQLILPVTTLMLERRTTNATARASASELPTPARPRVPSLPWPAEWLRSCSVSASSPRSFVAVGGWLRLPVPRPLS